MKYPNKIKHSFRASPVLTRALMFYAYPPKEIGRMYDGRNQGWEIHYRSPTSATWGVLELPDGWQDMDRTWTSQDVYWVDKYDCINVLEGV